MTDQHEIFWAEQYDEDGVRLDDLACGCDCGECDVYRAAKAADDGVRVPLEELIAELRAAEEELVAATINLATPYGRLEQQPTTTNQGE